ncbi:hypothetical protein PIB30_022926 [Stylosanthes scabra]|uniref:Aminotransferase-like plant mobile domain-containing protein n=1 Tax=Stylosanthes scabra TaxID=79078 RepID=A0ABU6Q968_9FABA|nr:hypothetical protein [Stylosanthes scabra]
MSLDGLSHPDRVVPQFGGVQDIPGHPVNIDLLHSKDGRGGDRWFPHTYQIWHGMWDSRGDRVMVIHRVDDPGASELYIRWWFLAGKRFLCGDAVHPDSRMTQVPVEASQRIPTAPQPMMQVDDVPDRRRPERQRRVGTRTTARDWQWVNRAMEEGEGDDVDVAPPRVRRMPEAAIGRHRRGGRRGQAGGGGTECGGGGSHAAEPSGSHVGQTTGVSTHGPASIEKQFGADSAYYVDLARCLQESPQGAQRGSSSQVPVDLNEPATDLFGDFSFALGVTPPSAFGDVPAPVHDDDQDRHQDPEPCRGRRVPRHRGCGTGGHI